MVVSCDLTQVATDVGLVEASSLMPPEPPPLRPLASVNSKRYDTKRSDNDEKTVRYFYVVAVVKF